jgi:predicted DNA binding CopG/RHH family protein
MRVARLTRGEAMKVMTIRMPDELLEWIRQKAARETINRKKSVSMNTMAVEILTGAMNQDKKGTT